MGLFAVNEHHGASDFVGTAEEIFHRKRNRRRHVPAGVRIERARMIAAFRLVVVEIVLHEPGRVVGELVGNAACARGLARLGVGGTLGVQLHHHFVARVRVHRVEVALSGHAAHVVHGRGNRRLDARVEHRGAKRQTAPAADPADADFVRIHVVAKRQIVDGGGKVLGVDVGRRDVARNAAAFARKGRIKGDGDETADRELLGVEARSLFLHGAEGSRDGDRGELPREVLRTVKVSGKFNAEAVRKADLFVRDAVVKRKGLVPFGDEVSGRSGGGSEDSGGSHDGGSFVLHGSEWKKGGGKKTVGRAAFADPVPVLHSTA